MTKAEELILKRRFRQRHKRIDQLNEVLRSKENNFEKKLGKIHKMLETDFLYIMVGGTKMMQEIREVQKTLKANKYKLKKKKTGGGIQKSKSIKRQEIQKDNNVPLSPRET